LVSSRDNYTPRPVLNKRDFRRRFIRNEFGNRGPTWNSLAEYQASGYRGLVHIRNGAVAGGQTFYNVGSKNVSHVWAKALKLQPTGWFVAAMAPHDKGTIQGEIRRSVDHLDLVYCSAKLPMREAMNKGPISNINGVMAEQVMKYYLNSNSYEWLQYLLTAYDDHVIEFSCFSVPWGTIANHNTVWWEVRKY
jgi:hypothetical protein